MSDAKRYTEREMVLAQRKAFITGVDEQRIREWPDWKSWDRTTMAAKVYPLPKVTRPRVVRDPHPAFNQLWRCVDRVLQWSVVGEPWHDLEARSVAKAKGGDVFGFVTDITPERLALWSNLLNNPNEEVEDEG